MSLVRDPAAAGPSLAVAVRRHATRSCARAARRHRPGELAARFGTPFYAYDLDVVATPGRGAPRGAPVVVRPRLRGQGEPEPRGRCGTSPGSGWARTSRPAASCATPCAPASSPDARRRDRARASATRSWPPPSTPACAP